MNSTEELSTYKEPTSRYFLPTKKSAYFEYDITDDKPVKKDKKWSFGNLFRRRKKNESSSDEDVLGKKSKKRKSDKKKKSINFDHVVVPPQIRPTGIYVNGNDHIDILSDPQENVKRRDYEEITQRNQLAIDNITRRSRKDLTKVRAEARRTSFNPNSSSDDDDSNSSHRFRSDESLSNKKDGSRRSRAARTERYLKRHSKDGENPYNYLRLSKSDASDTFLKLSDDSTRSPSASPNFKLSYTSVSSQSPSVIGLSTIPPSHTPHKFKVSNSTSNPSYKPPLSMNEYNNTAKINQRSVSFDANIHRKDEPQIVYGRLDLGKPRSRNFTIVERNPPPPPPPRRLHSNQNLDSNYENTRQVKKLNYLNSTFKSSSEDHIPRDPQVTLIQRPSSTTPDWSVKRTRSDTYQYLTDKQPRSRKPIFIQNEIGLRKSNSQKEILTKKPSSSRHSPQIFSCETKVQTQIFLPSVLPNNNKEDGASPKPQEVENIDSVNQNRRPTANLEEALNELEAIYNSLKLGDENLLEMAEKREKEEATERNRQYSWNSPRGTLSDSGFNYEPFDTLDTSRRKRYSRKSLISDDMAFRKINREDRAVTINDPQNVASKISYLLTSPIYSGEQPKFEQKNPNEPDITYDDVVYRNITHSNKLKVPEHPPPFGIPLGPITLAANSDYLHAVPEKESIKPSRIPDIVKDDLAYRNLRKDITKEQPALPQVLIAEDVKNNNSHHHHHQVDLTELRKKRAVRSKSANIGSLISQEVIDRASRRNARDRNTEEYKTLTDIADAMQIARQVLKDKEIKIKETKIASMSDTDANLKYTRYPLNRKEFRTPKEDTPEPVSSFEDSRLAPLFKTNSFEDALTALAIEAKEASDKFTRDLKEFDLDKDENSCKNLLKAATNDEIEHDYENLDVDLIVADKSGSKSPFEEHKTELLNTFKELKIEEKNVDDEEEPDYCNIEKKNDENQGEETCVDVVKSLALNIGECASKECKLKICDNLKSPKLVLETSKLNNCSMSSSNFVGNLQLRHIPDHFSKKKATSGSAWHNNPAELAIACSYGIACIHQLASLDLFTVMGIIFAVLTFIAALFI